MCLCTIIHCRVLQKKDLKHSWEDLICRKHIFCIFSKFWNWDRLLPFILKTIESHINLGQRHLIVKIRYNMKDEKSQGKCWSSLLSFHMSGWLWKSWHTELLDYLILSLSCFISLCSWPIVWQEPLKTLENLKLAGSTTSACL